MKFLRTILFSIVTLLIYLGVPLVSWGLGDLTGYFSTIPRLGYAIVVRDLFCVTGRYCGR